ncbi:hypothetical protein CJD36_017735 [Flavipsychrobacter stenotrophus]|uniref:histidine kinase n=1 Tax=Flavipsychrobacter stenotrophus TaxID=2077091 RepID=A0A2S7SS75_9BACT|nr:HAMP domain-containing sensor histidine kinase [Flavipsychrobacter stenotrophus]PQJ09769.1 hypothetical protein CJD36_017735 [Flavipsychrobacter stenotrophus]
MNLSIRGKIAGSFLILIVVFVANGIITIVTLDKSKKLSDYISTVIDPTQTALGDFKEVLIRSKMYTTNWVFLRADQEDKRALNDLHTVEYPNLKIKLNILYTQLNDRKMADSLKVVFAEFEQLIGIEQHLMNSLRTFTDYDDPVKKMNAEQLIDDNIIPYTAQLMERLTRILSYERDAKLRDYILWEAYSTRLRLFISVLVTFLAILSVILSRYFMLIIIEPIDKIRIIISDLGKGITRKIDDNVQKDEIGEMILSVNRLSEKLEEMATFAKEVGKRQFKLSYQPLSKQDTLGTALLTMRDNLKASEDELTQTASYLIQRNRDLEQFSYIISHNLRAPVANIRGIAQVIGFTDFTTDNNKELFDGLATSVEKLDGVIMDLNYILQFRQEITEQKENVHFSSLLEDVILSIDSIIKRENVKVTCDFSAINEIQSLKSYFNSIFFNLISNSIKYKQLEKQPVIRIVSVKLEDRLQIIFQDNGLGIDLAKRGGEVFGLYKRFHNHVDGKGMGLYMVKTQVESLGGKITVVSEINKGTKFIIEFTMTKQ